MLDILTWCQPFLFSDFPQEYHSYGTLHTLAWTTCPYHGSPRTLEGNTNSHRTFSSILLHFRILSSHSAEGKNSGAKPPHYACQRINIEDWIFIHWTIPYLPNFKFVRVCSLVGKYFYNMYYKEKKKLCLPLISRTIIYFHVYIILDFPIT